MVFQIANTVPIEAGMARLRKIECGILARYCDNAGAGRDTHGVKKEHCRGNALSQPFLRMLPSCPVGYFGSGRKDFPGHTFF